MTQPAVSLTPNGYTYDSAPSANSAKPTASHDSAPDAAQIAPFPNPKVPNYHESIPLQPYPIGSLLPAGKFPQNGNPPKLFEELTIRGVTFPNRCWVAPMCMCESDIRLVECRVR
jgi:hypothetical protein